MIQELEMVVFTHDLPERGLKKRDVGAVVHLSVGIGRSQAV